jgi:hypothetical protein
MHDALSLPIKTKINSAYSQEYYIRFVNENISIETPKVSSFIIFACFLWPIKKNNIIPRRGEDPSGAAVIGTGYSHTVGCHTCFVQS